jgi:hypothetical protein
MEQNSGFCAISDVIGYDLESEFRVRCLQPHIFQAMWASDCSSTAGNPFRSAIQYSRGLFQHRDDSCSFIMESLDKPDRLFPELRIVFHILFESF